MNTQYLLYILSRLLGNRSEGGIFATDETRSEWHKERDIEILKTFCREGYAMAKKYGHFIVGIRKDETDNHSYIGIPGRFLLEEQPAGGKTGFTLWQPLRGGEDMYDSLENMEYDKAVIIYGYWIAEVDEKTLEISEP